MTEPFLKNEKIYLWAVLKTLSSAKTDSGLNNTNSHIFMDPPFNTHQGLV